MAVNARQPSSRPRPPNTLLDRLPEDDYQRLVPLLERVRFPARHVLHEVGAPAPRVYFPTGGVCSVRCTMSDGDTVDVAMIGREGLVGIGAVLGAEFALHETVVRIPNEAQAISLAAFSHEMERRGAFNHAMMRYAQAFIAILTQAAACHALHPIEKRCARWLLEIADRMGRAEFPFTQELLGSMLGVRRASITTCAAHLHDAGLIEYGSRRLTIRDRTRLEAVSCECYATAKGTLSRLLA